MKSNLFNLLSLLVVLTLLLTTSGTPVTAQARLPKSNVAPESPPDKASSAPAAVIPSEATQARVRQSFGQLPLYFVENQGQLDERVAYYIQGSDKILYFTPDGVTFALTAPLTPSASLRASPPLSPRERDFDSPRPYLGEGSGERATQRWAVKLDFVDANPNVRPIGQDKTEAVISYFKGQPDQWHAGLPTYASIVYPDLWPGIDLVYYGTANQLKYEFIVHPGADPNQIRLAYRGATDVTLNAAGQMQVTTPLGGFTDDTPVAYQEMDGQRVTVPMAYQPSEVSGQPNVGMTSEVSALHTPPSTLYGFSVGSYDPTRPLILDPAVIVYCGYIGGSGSDYGIGIAVDGAGNAYVTGETNSTEASFPVTVGPDLTYNGSTYDAFVAKVNAAGTGLVYCGYIGGSGFDGGFGIAVDSLGNAYVTGLTTSTEASFPVAVGPDLTFNGGTYDAFVAKITTDRVYGTLQGRVTVQGSGAAVSNARVSVGGQVGYSDANGNYVLTNILAGPHAIYVSASGYEDYKGDVTIRINQSTTNNVALKPINVAGFYLPYPGGARYKCTQGNDGTSHQGTWYYAFDFGMPDGNKVVASREGRVVAVKEDSNTGCNSGACINQTNYVRIRHQGCTDTLCYDTLYYHLKYQRVFVEVDQFVSRGQVIAESDTTGWCTGPHLDFTLHYWDQANSIPISFVDVPGDGIPKQSEWYTSGNYPSVNLVGMSTLVTDTEPPLGSVRFRLTGQLTYTLQLWAADYASDVTAMRLAAAETETQSASWRPYTTSAEWTIPIVFAQFRDANGNMSSVASDTLDTIGYEPIQAAFAISPTVCVGQGLTLVNQTMPFCEQCGWTWDFGNGILSTEAEPQFDYVAMSSFFGYETPMTYTVMLTVSNVVSVSSVSHQVEALPVPSTGFTMTRSDATITVEAEATNASNWTWDFGDGITSTGRIATHTYSDTTLLDKYPVQLTVEGSNGCASFGHQFIKSEPPIGVAISGPVSGEVYAPYTFTATVNPTATLPITYVWQVTGISPVTNTDELSNTVTLTWTTPGTQAITVTATNTEGIVTGTHVITIVAGPSASITVTPNPVTVTVGATQTFTASGEDAFGNAVPISPIWSTDAGTMTDNILTAQTTPASGKHVTATVMTTGTSAWVVSGTAIVNIVTGPLASITVTPNPVTVTVGMPQTFTAAGADAFDNPVSISPTWSTDAGTMAGNILTAQMTPVSGKHVTATVGSVSGTAVVNIVDRQYLVFLPVVLR